METNQAIVGKLYSHSSDKFLLDSEFSPSSADAVMPKRHTLYPVGGGVGGRELDQEAWEGKGKLFSLLFFEPPIHL